MPTQNKGIGAALAACVAALAALGVAQHYRPLMQKPPIETLIAAPPAPEVQPAPTPLPVAKPAAKKPAPKKPVARKRHR